MAEMILMSAMIQERPFVPPLKELTEWGIDYAFPPVEESRTPIEKGLQFLNHSDLFEAWVEISPVQPNEKGDLCKPPFKKK